MKLLFDEHLSYKLVPLLSDIFPNSKHVNDLGLTAASDREIWDYAKMNNYVIATKDSDFIDISNLFGAPPFVIWIRSGNTKVKEIENVFRKYSVRIHSAIEENEAGTLQLK